MGLLFAVSCPDPDGRGDAESQRAALGEPCTVNTDCEVGLLCTDQVCADPNMPDDQANSVNDAGASTTQTTVADAGNPSTDTSVHDAGSGLPQPQDPYDSDVRPWLLSVVNGGTDSAELFKIDTETGEYISLCLLGVNKFYTSTTFGINGVLYASNSTDHTIEILDPCSCDLVSLGETGYGTLPGITANGVKEDQLYGIETTNDLLLELSTETGSGTPVGELGLNFTTSGTTWSNDIAGLYALNGDNDMLYTLDLLNGNATEAVQLDADFHYVGIEWNPYDSNLYACTNGSGGLGTSPTDNFHADDPAPGLSKLYKINPDTGHAEFINSLPGACNNLAAPWTAVHCVDVIDVIRPDDSSGGETADAGHSGAVNINN
ncbi:MAG: hypothetical protein CMH56_06640 [Myxococcales bacterium]|nr:hypothetical protein [Myxococcales bacterium]